MSTQIGIAPPLGSFISEDQLYALREGLKGEEKQFFLDKVEEIKAIIAKMPKTGQTDGQGDKAIVYLHYFKGSADWYITEKDMIENEQFQAFGHADLFGDGGELGYISIEELIQNGVELDLHWKPKTLAEAKRH
jgi:hypothetical protein